MKFIALCSPQSNWPSLLGSPQSKRELSQKPVSVPVPPPILEVEADADTTTAMPAQPSQTAALVRQEREPQTNREPKRPRPEAPPNRPKLFTEQRDEFRRSHTPAPRSQDLGNLWLVTTILLVVFTAFGAGFLIMRPLLSR
jgi:hypothetical protein